MKSAIKSSRAEKSFDIFNVVFMVLISLIFILPFWMVFVTSFVSSTELSLRGSFIMFPWKWDFTAYKILLDKNSLVYNAYTVTLFVVVTGTAISLFITSLLAYGLSKKTLPGKTFFTGMIFFTMLFNGGLIPSYMLNKSLGLLDSLWVLILPMMVSSWNIFILRNFFSQLPDSLEEAALIDGASPLKILLYIIFPISIPVLMTIGLFYAVGYWNAWFSAAIYINDVKKLPVQNIMRNIIVSNTASDISTEMSNMTIHKPTADSLKSAVIMVCTIPIICIYPFIQKYFVKGVMVGSIKG